MIPERRTQLAVLAAIGLVGLLLAQCAAANHFIYPELGGIRAVILQVTATSEVDTKAGLAGVRTDLGQYLRESGICVVESPETTTLLVSVKEARASGFPGVHAVTVSASVYERARLLRDRRIKLHSGAITWKREYVEVVAAEGVPAAVRQGIMYLGLQFVADWKVVNPRLAERKADCKGS